ncbi:MAG TPA: HD-GYP domain-containing protein [Mobilitalea sp.]|nr:HD-GYP domain-containing protein [Mobilitalea sp.]
MRYLPIDKVILGTYLARPIYNSNGTILLTEKFQLSESVISRLKSLGYTGLYIEDEISKGIDIIEVVEEKMRLEATCQLETIVKNNGNLIDILPAISNIVESILDNKDVLIQMKQLQDFHDYTYSHCVNVGILAVSIGVKYNFTKDELFKLGVSGVLHDIGKQSIPLEILDKPASLSEAEYEVIKGHPVNGYNMLKDILEFSSLTKAGVLQHHERCDGSGYPRGLKDKDINIFAKIIAIADTYDAMTSNRSYRAAYSPVEAYEYLLGDGGNRFDLNIVRLFMQCFAVYPVGTCVELSDGTNAIVIQNYSDNPLRPLLRNIITNDTIDLNNDMDFLSLCIRKVSDN